MTDRKLKMSAVLISEIKGAKKGKIFNFLNGSFSVMRGPMDMIFGVFSESYARLLTFVAFVVFEILLNLVSMQNLLNANNC